MFYKNNNYVEDLNLILYENELLKYLDGCSILIAGASGLIGSYLVDLLMLYNNFYNGKIKIFAMGRNKSILEKRFESHNGHPNFHILEHDVIYRLEFEHCFDYIIHAASNAYPHVFSTDPVGTITGNILGTINLLEHARKYGVKRFLFVSSAEVYGHGTEQIEGFEESYSGYIDNMNPRSSYPIAKRTAETLSISYTKQHGIDTVIARPCHIYGPTVSSNDNRASAQFINNVLNGEKIVMKSSGTQLRSYCYVADCVSALITILLRGKTANAYNISNSESNVTIRELAESIAKISGQEIIYEVPDEIESAGYNPVSRSIVKANKLIELGWKPQFNLDYGLKKTIEILMNTTR